MFSSFTWLDYSEHERRKMLDIVKLFTGRETRDELGIGSVRDAFADLFFPGTSTIQTRARYFFFVPWMYLDLENKRGDAGKIADRARQREINLIKALKASGEGEGVSGRRANDRLLRLRILVWNFYALGGDLPRLRAIQKYNALIKKVTK